MASLQFGLYRFVFLHADDGLVRSFRMVHRELALVDKHLFRQVVVPEGLLKEQVPGVVVVSEDASDTAFTPWPTQPAGNTVCVQAIGDGDDPLAGKELPENALDRFGLVRLNDVDAVPVAVAEERPVPRLALLEILTHTPFLIFAGRKALFLCVGARIESINSPSAERVWMFCSSKKTSIPRTFRSRTVSSSVTVFRANREIDLVMTISTFPALQSDTSLTKASLVSLVPVLALSAYTQTYCQPG